MKQTAHFSQVVNSVHIHFASAGYLDCEETYRRIGDLVGSELALTLAFLANGHRKELFCDGIWGCDGTTVDVSTKPYEVKTVTTMCTVVEMCNTSLKPERFNPTRLVI